jgi:hypothetical protein
MSRSKKGRTKQARKGQKRKTRRSKKRQKHGEQLDTTSVSNVTTSSGKTVGELVNELNMIVKQLGNLVVGTTAAGTNAVEHVAQQAGELAQGSDSSDVAAALGMNEETSPVTGIQRQMTTRQQRRSDQVAA